MAKIQIDLNSDEMTMIRTALESYLENEAYSEAAASAFKKLECTFGYAMVIPFGMCPKVGGPTDLNEIDGVTIERAILRGELAAPDEKPS